MDELVALYGEGVSIAGLGRKFGIHSRTAAAHLVRRSVSLRQRGLAMTDVPKAVELYENGITLVEIGLHFGVSQGSVRRVVAAEGVEIRPRGRRPPQIRSTLIIELTQNGDHERDDGSHSGEQTRPQYARQA